MLQALREECLGKLEQATTMEALEDLRVFYLGKKGKLTDILKQMGKLTAEERPRMGKVANEIRDMLEGAISDRKELLRKEQQRERLLRETCDITALRGHTQIGHLHPLPSMIARLEELFLRMGFLVIDGPEVETVENNFDLLNTPKDHPSRERSDTFYLDDEHVLRSQTSPVQIRAMKQYGAPIKMISAGRTFRNDEVDDTHSPMFHQIEGLVVDKGITIAHLKSTIDIVIRELFGTQLATRYRPHYFPFTEPSLEVDVTCTACGGSGCPKCSYTGWSMELLGCGMVHPHVLAACGIDPEVYSGFAFGMGIDRLTMVRHGISDLRVLFDNDQRVREQF